MVLGLEHLLSKQEFMGWSPDKGH